ncbi:hypothetical protein H097_12973 [Pseudomonas sp. FH4]|uniref:hypothetical protein n=1 Tax=Pseudomonas fluorescens group TaxID=136843 RepID=UPI0003DDEBB0|nr:MULTISPECIES: hypothetical protein [Pseudomonas fluorescens group]ETK18218.1 hypothetical protein H097_12973 [Pseudomonas sp. FH4]MBF8007147.1 hypothetical protein [Pseudomonas brenneri]
MMAQEITRLSGKLVFNVDMRQMLAFERKLVGLQRRLQEFGKAANKKLKLDVSANAGNLQKQLKQNTALSKAQFAAQMQSSKFTLATEKARTALSIEQTKQALKQSQVAKAAQQHSMRAEVHAQRMQRERATTAAAEARSRTALGRAEAYAQQLHEKRHKAAQRQAQRASYQRSTGSVHRGGHGLGGMAGRMSMMPSIGPVFGLGSAAAGATVAIGAMAAAAIAASLAFAASAEKTSNARDTRMASFTAAAGSKEGGARMEKSYQSLADFLGLNAKEGGRDYAKLTGAFAKRMGVDKAEDTSRGIMSFGKSQGMSQEDMSNMNRGIIQALGKNQLYSEEWTGQISEHMGASANQYGAEAWQRTIKGNLKGDAAEKAFSDAREKKLIKGSKVVTAFFENLGAIMKQHANDGGALDVARNTQESRTNRFSNQLDNQMVQAYESNNGKLKAATGDYAAAKLELLKSLGPQFDQFGSFTADTLDSLTRILKLTKELVDTLNSPDPKAMERYFSPESIEKFKQAWDTFGDSMTNHFGTLKRLWQSIFGEDSSRDILSFLLSRISDVLNLASAAFSVLDAAIEKIRAVLIAAGMLKPDAEQKKISEVKAETAAPQNGNQYMTRKPLPGHEWDTPDPLGGASLSATVVQNAADSLQQRISAIHMPQVNMPNYYNTPSVEQGKTLSHPEFDYDQLASLISGANTNLGGLAPVEVKLEMNFHGVTQASEIIRTAEYEITDIARRTFGEQISRANAGLKEIK